MNVEATLAKMVPRVKIYKISTNANVWQDLKEPTVRRVSGRIRPLAVLHKTLDRVIMYTFYMNGQFKGSVQW